MKIRKMKRHLISVDENTWLNDDSQNEILKEPKEEMRQRRKHLRKLPRHAEGWLQSAWDEYRKGRNEW